MAKLRNVNRKPLRHAEVEEIREMKFEGECDKEVRELTGERYKHGKINVRHGVQPGSIAIANQRVAIERPRVRSKDGREIPLIISQEFQDERPLERAAFAEGLKRVAQRDYEKGLTKIASSFGFKKSAVSRKWIRATAAKIEELKTRDLRPLDVRAVFIDGKRFRQHGVIVALGVGIADLGALVRRRRWLGPEQGAPDQVRRARSQATRAIRIRCFVHKWRSIEAALGDEADKASGLFWSLRDAGSLTEANAISERLEAVLKRLKLSALESYREAKDDLLAIHDLSSRSNSSGSSRRRTRSNRSTR